MSRIHFVTTFARFGCFFVNLVLINILPARSILSFVLDVTAIITCYSYSITNAVRCHRQDREKIGACANTPELSVLNDG